MASKLASHLSKVKSGLLIVGTIVVPLAMLAIAYEKDFVSRPAGQMEIVIVRVQVDKPQGRQSPPWIRYVVALPDGSRGIFVSEQLHRPGTRILATVSRGRITDRTWFGSPYVVLPGPIPE